MNRGWGVGGRAGMNESPQAGASRFGFGWGRRPANVLFSVAAWLVLLGPASNSHAVPSFGKQTGQVCASCHTTGFSVLSPFGRQFKLRAYSLGEANLPLAFGGIVSATRSNHAAGGEPMAFAENDRLIVQRLSAFVAGKMGEGAGVFVNWNYDTVERRGSMEMVDLRHARSLQLGGKELLLGVSLNNNPTVSDIYNSTPAFGFPQISPSEETVVSPPAMAQVDMSLASQVAGLSAYAWWDNAWYAELGAYRTADGVLSILRAGVPRTGEMEAAAEIRRGAPYWRLAREFSWGGFHSLAVGTFGLLVDRYPDPGKASGPTDGYRDRGFDAQYQYSGDEHRLSSGLTWIDEKQSWRASYQPSATENQRDGAAGRLRSVRAHAAYLYRQRHGASVGYFSTRGNTDFRYYASGEPLSGSVAGKPDNAGAILEASYLPTPNVRLGLRYTAYAKFNGARSNYDGYGRRASDNNQLYFSSWFLY